MTERDLLLLTQAADFGVQGWPDLGHLSAIRVQVIDLLDTIKDKWPFITAGTIEDFEELCDLAVIDAKLGTLESRSKSGDKHIAGAIMHIRWRYKPLVASFEKAIRLLRTECLKFMIPKEQG